MLVENSETRRRLAAKRPQTEDTLTDTDRWALNYGAWREVPVKERITKGLLTLWFILIYLVDIGSDIWVAHRHYIDGNYGYLSATLTFIIVPAIITSFFSLRWYCSDVKVRGERKSKFLIIFHCLNLGPLISYVDGYNYSTQSSKTTEGIVKLDYLKKQAYSDAAHLRLIEGFMESIPQCILQIFIISRDHRHQTNSTTFYTQVFSIWMSLVSVARSLVSHNEHVTPRLPWVSGPGRRYFFWRLLEVGPRVVALGLFASLYPQIIGCVCLVRGLFMVGWILQKEKSEYAEKGLEKWLHIILVGWLFNFCCLLPPQAEVLKWMSPFYIITCVENGILVFMWAHDHGLDTWYPWIIALAVLVLYPLGIFIMVTGHLYREFAIKILTVRFRATYCKEFHGWKHWEEYLYGLRDSPK